MREVVPLGNIDKAATVFLREVKKLLKDNAHVVVSVSGGSSLKEFYRKVPEHSDLLTREEWNKVHFFWTDERLVEPTDKDSNFKAPQEMLKGLGARRLLLEENVHRFHGEAEDVESELARYETELEQYGKINIPLLGVGPDGHTASLFPNHDLLESEASGFLHIEDSPKPPPERMTISPRMITKADTNFIFFVGDKKEAYEKFMSGTDTKGCPCRLAKHGEGFVYVFTDLP